MGAELVQTRRMSQREGRGKDFLNAASEFSVMSRTKFFHYDLAYACAHVEGDILLVQVCQDVVNALL